MNRPSASCRLTPACSTRGLPPFRELTPFRTSLRTFHGTPRRSLASVLLRVYSLAMGADITVVIDRSKDEPAYEQIARQIRAHIAGGGLTAGTPLPGVRTLAADLGVNLNTVARAYRLLADQGFVRIRDRSGVAVAAPASSPDPEASEVFKAELDAL